jgi:hypothetical protein
LTRILSARKLGANEMTDTIRPWLYYGAELSPDTLLSKTVTIGPLGMPANVVEFDTTVRVSGRRPYYQVEAPTGYMPESFNTFYYHAGSHWVPLKTSPYGHTVSYPVVAFDQKDGVAMGIYGFGRPVGYGAWDFGFVTKLAVAYHEAGPVHGTYHYKAYVVVGTIAAVERTLARVAASPPPSGAAASEISDNHANGDYLQSAEKDHTIASGHYDNTVHGIRADRFVFNTVTSTGATATVLNKPTDGGILPARSDFQAERDVDPTVGFPRCTHDDGRHEMRIDFTLIARDLDPHHPEFLVHA